MIVRILTGDDASAYQHLRLQGLQESPSAFGASYVEEEARSLEEVALRITPAADGSLCAFGAFAGERLVGLLTFVRSSREKVRHAAELCGMYVAPDARRRGNGSVLLDAAIAHARSLPGMRQLRLSVNTTNDAACALYESHDFVRVGCEPDSLCIDGQFYDEAIYVLRWSQSGKVMNGIGH